MTTKTFFKRAVAFLLVAIMLFGMIPATVLAETTGGEKKKGIYLSKTATKLDENFISDVTLQVGGDSFMDPVDIIFVIGAGIAQEASTINQAVALFESLLVKDIPVKLGIVSLEAAERVALDLNSEEADLRQYYLNGTLESFVEAKYNSIVQTMHPGTTNLDGALKTAWDMLKKDNEVKDENKFVFTISTGRTYWFDNEDGKESTVIAVKEDSKGAKHYLWGSYMWRKMRSATGTSTYVVPGKYNNDFTAYWNAMVNIIENVDKDKYVYTPADQTEVTWYSTWSATANNGAEYKEGTTRFGGEIDTPAPYSDNFLTGIVDAVPFEAGYDSTTKEYASCEHALNYERAQYEAWKTYTAMDETYNMFAICSESAGYRNNEQTKSIGHSYMDLLAGGKAPILYEEGFFQPIADQIKKTHNLAEGSYVKDYMGYNDGTNGEDKYNFDFIDETDTLVVKVGADEYFATKIETTEGATSTYSFKDGKFIVDYYYGDGGMGEYFIWKFNEVVSSETPVSFSYKVKLVEKPATVGHHDLDTNRVATLHPVDSEGVEAEPTEFPVPEVELEKIQISGFKTWDDDDNNDGIRPESITINLKENGEIIATKEVSEADNWQWTFEVYKKENAQYTIEEVAVDGYTPEYDDNFNVINKHENEQIVILGSKNWDDVNDADAIRPDSITVNLLVNDEVVDTKTVTAEDGWTWSFVVDKYEDGAEIEYTISEDEVDGYTTEISGSVADGFVITNTHVPTIDITVNKTWDDEDNVDGIRPESITVHLFAGNEEVATQVITAEDGWTYTFAGLVKYNENGEEIVYTISEDEVDGYETTIDGFEITNTHIPTILEDPEIPEGPGPATGGAATLFGWFTLAIASGALALTMLFSEKKRLANSK